MECSGPEVAIPDLTVTMPVFLETKIMNVLILTKLADL
jgi:hypothetical protein